MRNPDYLNLIEECIEYTTLVRLLKRKRNGLIQLPSSLEKREKQGSDIVQIVAVAANAWLDKGYTEDTRPLKPGDYAIFQKYAGCKIPQLDEGEEEELRFAKDEEFLGKLNKDIVEKYYEIGYEKDDEVDYARL